MGNGWAERSRAASTAHPAPLARSAFTLVELLVVIGIIALLISIVLPSILAARRHANLVRCQANLREIATGCLLHAHEHRGYLPLAGNLQLEDAPWTEMTIRAGLSDTERKRYTYATAAGTGMMHVITPLPAAIAPYLGTKHLDYSDWNTLDQQLNDTLGIWKMFMCPCTDSAERHRLYHDPRDTTPTGQGTMMVVSIGQFMTLFWSTNSDFAMNEGVFGFDYRTQYSARRLAGNLARVQRPSETMLFCDAGIAKTVEPSFPSHFQYPWITFTPALEAPSPGAAPVTLADALAGSDKVMPYRAQLDAIRHRGRANVVFADGHVESVVIAAGTLQRVRLSAR